MYINTDCIYDSEKNSLYTFLKENKCIYTGIKAEEILKENSAFQIMKIEKAINIIDERREREICGKYKRISKKLYYNCLECLPPEKYEQCNNAVIFRMREYLIDNITEHLIAVNNKYFSVNFRTTKKYSEIYSEVMKKYFKKNFDN